MRTVMVVCMFLFSFSVFGEEAIRGLPDQTIRQLRDLGFEIAFSAIPDKQASVSAEIRKEAENRFLQIVAPNLFPMVNQKPAFATCPSTLGHSDGFAVSAEYEGDNITAFVSEFYTDFFIIPQNPIRQDNQTVQAAFHSWTSRLLMPMWLAEGAEKRIEVLDRGDFLQVIRVFFEMDATRRFTPWTKGESQKMAIDKDGRWLIFSIRDVAPWVCTSCPPGAGRERYRGNWFTGPPKGKYRIYDFKKFGPVGPKPAKPSHPLQN